MARPLTDRESKVFDAITGASNIALVQCKFDGEETAVIAVVNEDGDDYVITPLAVLLTESMFGKLTDPMEEE
jgi:hypothetical protein